MISGRETGVSFWEFQFCLCAITMSKRANNTCNEGADDGSVLWAVYLFVGQLSDLISEVCLGRLAVCGAAVLFNFA